MLEEEHKLFGREWSPKLEHYGIFGPLHMTDFVRPYGKHIGIHYELKLALFAELCKIINKYKVYSLSVAIPQVEFDARMPENVRQELLGPYALAFFCLALLNQGIGRQVRSKDLIASYLVDHGCAYPEQLLKAHANIQRAELVSRRLSRTAALGFDTNDRVVALQAADLIAWSARRREVYGDLKDEFAPLKEVLLKDLPGNGIHTASHQHVLIPGDGVEMFAAPIREWIYRKGDVPKLDDFLRWRR